MNTNGIFYTTIENQLRPDGTFGLLYDHYDDYDQALAKYFTVCAAAAISGIPYHEAVLLSSNTGYLRREVWDRRLEQSAGAAE